MLNTQKIEQIIENTLRNKMKKYNPEASDMPFHTRLLGKDRMALFSFLHSVNTSFGTGIFEPVAAEVAKGHFDEVKLQHKIGNAFSKKAQSEIAEIINKLTTCEIDADHAKEVEQIKKHCQSGGTVQKKLRKVDIFLSKGNQVFLIDLKTAKPNIGNFEHYKQTLLEWAAAVLHATPKANVRTLIAIPYNPDHPKPYSRWTMKGMLDIENQLKVAENFWNFLAGGNDVYEELLDCFERVGVRLRGEIDAHFQKYGTADRAQKNAEEAYDESEKAKCPNCGETKFSMVSENKETVCFVMESGEFTPDVLESEYMYYDTATCTACNKDFDVSELELELDDG